MATTNKQILDQPQEFPWASVLETPLDVLTFYDESVQNGSLKLTDWQVKILKEFGKPRESIDELIEIMLKCNNGAGKSQVIIAPCIIWTALKFLSALAVLTVSSGFQLDNQVGAFVKRLAYRVNAVHNDELDGAKVFDILYRTLKCNITHSEIKMFATDEPGKAEGFHRLKPDGEFIIATDESKSIDDDIFQALDRMRDKTRRLDTSSPGPTIGYFYSTWSNENLKHINRHTINAFQCPWIPKEAIAKDIAKYGHNHPFIRSSIYAEFTNSDDEVIITRDMLYRCIKLCQTPVHFGPLRAGLDLSWSLGGDECVMSVWLGNEELDLFTWKHSDTTDSEIEIIRLVNLYGGRLQWENIYADDGGAGKGILDNLYKKGFKINRVLNNWRANDITRYANKGTENWYNLKRYIEENQLKFKVDPITRDMDSTSFRQLSARYRRYQQLTGKIIVEPKKEAKSKGHPSPDRADAMVLAWHPLIFPCEELSEKLDAKTNSNSSVKIKPMTMEEIETKKIFERQQAILTGNMNSFINNRRSPLYQNNITSNGDKYINTDGFSFSYNKIFDKSSNSLRKLFSRNH